MNYIPKFIENKTIEELRQEEEEMVKRQYRDACFIDRPRMWDVIHTIKILKNKEN